MKEGEGKTEELREGENREENFFLAIFTWRIFWRLIAIY